MVAGFTIFIKLNLSQKKYLLVWDLGFSSVDSCFIL